MIFKSQSSKLGVLTILFVILTLVSGLWWLSRPCRLGCNVILIMVDTLSAEHLKTYGYDRDTMPKTTAFFEKSGVIFDNANSNAPWTLPSFTGMYFSDIASHITFAELDNGTRPSLQSELRKNGNIVRAVVPGLDNFILDGITRVYKKDELLDASKSAPLQVGAEEVKKLTSEEKPFFLLVHSFQVHDPYKPPPPFDEKYASSPEYPVVTRDDITSEYQIREIDPAHVEIFRLRYDQQISSLDEEFATFLNDIPEEALKNTVVILAADHGESFNEHGVLYHANNLFQEELHVPLMMRVPGVTPRRIPDAVSLLDIAPTVLSLMHVEVPKRFLGESLVPLFTGGKLAKREILSVNGRPTFMTWMNRLFVSIEEAGAIGSTTPVIVPFSVGVRIGSNRVFFEANSGVNHGLHWYDLHSDPNERHNLADGKRPVPNELLEPLQRLSKDFTPALKVEF